MAFVRTITYTFPYEQIGELQPGSETWMRLVPANKLICQESEGMLDTGVWIRQLADGALQVVSYTEWYSIEDLNSFNGDPDVRHHEAAIGRSSTVAPPVVTIYETIG
jgi:hypothetical protein